MPLPLVMAKEYSHRPPSLILSLFTLLCFLCYMHTWVTKACCWCMGVKQMGAEAKLCGVWWMRHFSLPLLPYSPVSASSTHKRKILKSRILLNSVCLSVCDSAGGSHHAPQLSPFLHGHIMQVGARSVLSVAIAQLTGVFAQCLYRRGLGIVHLPELRQRVGPPLETNQCQLLVNHNLEFTRCS